MNKPWSPKGRRSNHVRSLTPACRARMRQVSSCLPPASVPGLCCPTAAWLEIGAHVKSDALKAAPLPVEMLLGQTTQRLDLPADKRLVSGLQLRSRASTQRDARCGRHAVSVQEEQEVATRCLGTSIHLAAPAFGAAQHLFKQHTESCKLQAMGTSAACSPLHRRQLLGSLCGLSCRRRPQGLERARPQAPGSA